MKSRKIQYRVKDKPVYGAGINDADYAVFRYENINGKSKSVWRCPFYVKWNHMLERCFSSVCHEKHPCYVNCQVVPEWLYFSSFKSWMELQDWEGKQLDKDLLIPGNKTYSPDTCVFLSRQLNTFLTDRTADRGDLPLGVTRCHAPGKFRAKCNNPFTGRQEHIGFFDSPASAHEAWRNRKHDLACQYADLQSDPRVADALRSRFSSHNIQEAA